MMRFRLDRTACDVPIKQQDHWTRRIVGFGVHRSVVDGVALCRMFNRATRGESLPTYLSADHDPLYRFHQWQANLRILNIREIKTVPYVPCSHPVVERLIGTVRRECLDRLLFWTAADLERKLAEFQQYYNEHRTHTADDPGIRAVRSQSVVRRQDGSTARTAPSWQANLRILNIREIHFGRRKLASIARRLLGVANPERDHVCIPHQRLITPRTRHDAGSAPGRQREV